MSDFLLELYSEEIPHGLQIDARNSLQALFVKKLEDQNKKRYERTLRKIR